MASNRLRRVAKELADIQADTESKIFCEPANGSELSHLRGSFPGPPDTPYEGGTYVVDVKIPSEYPFRPPVMFFTTKLWHPNVSSQTVGFVLVGYDIRLTSIGSHLSRYPRHSLVARPYHQIRPPLPPVAPQHA
jgi:Ubiquitin-conjugating enzyme